MKILVTGGTGVIGAGAIPELLKHGHTVRLLSRGATRDARDFPERVEAFAGDVTEAASLAGAADGCDAVIHIAGVVDEDPPEVTFEKINVAGTRHVLAEAERSGVRRFIFISSLGADTGSSEYHRSKRRAEELVRGYPREWVILRPGNVYGPGDEVISALLKMVRALPVVPVVGKGDQPFQPIWFEDMGRVLARALESREVVGQSLEVAGAEVTSTTELLDILGEITARRPTRVPVPEWIAKMGASLGERMGGKASESSGIPLPLTPSKLQMLLEENVIGSARGNALLTVFQMEPTPLREGLTALADSIPELLPEDGFGSLERKRFWTEIHGSRHTHNELLRVFCENVTKVMPIEFAAEPGVPAVARKGMTLTGAIPGRGNFQVRVEDEQENSVTLATLEGHPLAGIVIFRTEPVRDEVRFSIETYTRASNVIDWLALRAGGGVLQNQNWRGVITRVVELSGGKAPDGVRSETVALKPQEAEEIEQYVARLVRERKREEVRAKIT